MMEGEGEVKRAAEDGLAVDDAVTAGGAAVDTALPATDTVTGEDLLFDAVTRVSLVSEEADLSLPPPPLTIAVLATIELGVDIMPLNEGSLAVVAEELAVTV